MGVPVLPNSEPTAISVTVASASVAAEVLSALSNARIQLTDFSLGAPSLDDVFFSLTGRPPERRVAEKESAS